MARRSDAVHLHVHSHYSLLDGAAKVEDLVATAERFKMPALAITDHGNMFGAIEFYETALKSGVKPIIGYEAYVAPGSRFDRAASGIKEASFHLTLLAQNHKGYRNLLKLASAAYLEGFYYKPRIDKELLAQHHEGLVALSGCLSSEVCHLVLSEREEEAATVLRFYRDLFGKEAFYVEIQDNGLEQQTNVNKVLVRLARKLEIPLVATTDVHYLLATDREAHEVLLCISTGKTLADETRLTFGSDQFYFKSPEELRRGFQEVPEAVDNTLEIARRCNVELNFREQHLPKFTPPDGLTSAQQLRKLAEEGLRRRYGTPSPESVERMNYELSVIEQTGFSSYYLIVSDFIRYARERGIRVGPGRGSVVGSLVAYLIGITNVDPLPYGLLFERFLTPDRVSPPDADIDFRDDRRDEVVEYVRQKYGGENIASIITFGTLGAKAAVRDIARVMGLPYGDADSIAKLIPSALHVTLRDALSQEPELRKRYENEPTVRKIIDIGFRLEGLCRHASRHACGVVIADKPITEYAPLYRSGDTISTQYDMSAVEKIGLLKVDFLGLSNLTVMDRGLELIERDTGKRIDIDHLTFDDPKVFELFSRGETRGIFQFESSGMRNLLRKLMPETFEQLLQANALYRPGPMASIPTFVACRHGHEKPSYLHPSLEPLLEETYGVMTFQEQVMKIANVIGGFTLAEADNLRKAMGKKRPEIMAQYSEKFVAGARQHGLEPHVAEQLFEQMAQFAGYGFNKSHACGYGVIAYQEAYLKTYYPKQYMAALLTVEIGNTDKIVEYVDECRRMNIDLLPPSINESETEFVVVDGKIRFALAAVKNVGRKMVDAIVEERRRKGAFRSFIDFFERVDIHQLNRQAVESLIKAGAFDCVGQNRARMIASVEIAMERGARVQADQLRGQKSLFETPAAAADEPPPATEWEEWSERQALAAEKEVLGLYLSSHPLAKYADTLKLFSTATTRELPGLEDGTMVVLGGLVQQVKARQVQNGRSKGHRMGQFTLEDLEGTVEAVAFPSEWQRISSLVKVDRLVFVRGRLSFRNGEPSVRVNTVIPIEEAHERLTSELVIMLDRDMVDDTLLDALRSVLAEHLGSCPLVIQVRLDDQTQATIQAGHDFRVRPSPELAQSLREILGGHGSNGAVKFRPV